MILYRTKDIVPLFWTRRGKPFPIGRQESEKQIGVLVNSKASITSRLVLLAEKGVVQPAHTQGKRHGSVRLYDKEAVLEMAIAFELMGYGVPTHTIRWVLGEYRQKGRKRKKTNLIVLYQMMHAEGMTTAGSYEDVPAAIKRETQFHPIEEINSLLIVNVALWRSRIEIKLRK